MSEFPQGCGATNVKVRRCKIAVDGTLKADDIELTRDTCKLISREIIYLCEVCQTKNGIRW